MGDRCLFCSADATGYCDATIGLVSAGWHKPKGGPPYLMTTMDAMLSVSYTCDAPCCDQHRRIVGFVCGKDADTIDHCAGCFGRYEPAPLLEPAQIAAIRTQRHTSYRRGRIATLPREITP